MPFRFPGLGRSRRHCSCDGNHESSRALPLGYISSNSSDYSSDSEAGSYGPRGLGRRSPPPYLAHHPRHQPQEPIFSHEDHPTRVQQYIDDYHTFEDFGNDEAPPLPSPPPYSAQAHYGPHWLPAAGHVDHQPFHDQIFESRTGELGVIGDIINEVFAGIQQQQQQQQQPGRRRFLQRPQIQQQEYDQQQGRVYELPEGEEEEEEEEYADEFQRHRAMQEHEHRRHDPRPYTVEHAEVRRRRSDDIRTWLNRGGEETIWPYEIEDISDY